MKKLISLEAITEPETFYVTDANVFKLYNYLFTGKNTYVLKATEESKSFKETEKISSWLFKNGATKAATLVAVGGGVVTDITSFVASIYNRGLKLVLVPTTLIAMVDASIGGKTGINFSGVKNKLGTFYKPTGSQVYYEFLETLPEPEILSGLGEICKALVISKYFLKNPVDLEKKYNLEYLIKEAIKVKEEIVTSDPYDTKLRHILNFGHTAGHMLEVKYHLKHGLAVASGMLYESGSLVIKNLLDLYNVPYQLDYDIDLDIISSDKKNENGILAYYEFLNENEFKFTERKVLDAVSQFKANALRLKSR